MSGWGGQAIAIGVETSTIVVVPPELSEMSRTVVVVVVGAEVVVGVKVVLVFWTVVVVTSFKDSSLLPQAITRASIKNIYVLIYW